MHFICLLFSGATVLVLVNPHPLVQNIQPYPITNHQHVYQPLCNEAFIVQPLNIDHYSQPITVQTPVATYQPLPGPSLTEQITQLVWDKILLDPSLRKILDPQISCDQTCKDVHTNLHPYNKGGVVNNFIIVPPDYIKLNETVKRPKINRVSNEPKKPVKENVAANDNKRKLTNNNKAHIKNTKSSIKQSKKEKENAEKTWSFYTDNIKCFTPVEVLKNEKYQPERNADKNKEATKQSRKGNSNRKSIKVNKCENKNKSHKSNKTNKVKNKSMPSRTKECKKKEEKNISKLNKEPKKTIKERNKKESNIYTSKCAKGDDKTKAVEDVPQFCELDIEDLLLSTLLQQSCPNLENRCTRNSKTDTAKKDLRSMYPEIPGDISNTFNWYLNDLYSPHSLQQALNSNAFQGNKYPFDFSQIYQIPQYSNADTNKQKGNTGKNKNTKRKKKKKKNSKTKTRKESVSDSDDINYSEISDSKKNVTFSDTDTKISEIITETYEKFTQDVEISTQPSETMTRAPEVSSHTEKSTNTKDESTIKTTDMNNVMKLAELPPFPNEKITTETVRTTSITSVDKTVTKHAEEILEDKFLQIWDEHRESEEEDSKELYETQIPYSVVVHIDNENNTEMPESEEKVTDEMLPILGFDRFNHHDVFGSEDEFFKMYMYDYYPDFRGDNHAYLVNDEEEMRNIDERYLYVTDKNIDSREVYSPEEVHQLYDKGTIYDEDKLQNLDTFKHTNHKNKAIKEDKSQEIVFRAPPGLENPDFMTRKINKSSIDSTEVYYLHENLDDFDSLDNFADKSDNYETPKRNDSSGRIVETVYAKSKVVKYGQGQEVIKSKPEPITSLKNDRALQNDGKTSVVIAKSLPGEFW